MSRLSMSFPDRIGQTPTYREAVFQARDWTRDVIGRWSETKRLSWDLKQADDGRPLFDLMLESEDAGVSARFDEFELRNEDLFKSRVRDLWGQLVDQLIRSDNERLKGKLERWLQESAVGSEE